MNRLLPLPLLLCLIVSTAQAQYSRYSPWARYSIVGGAVETRTVVPSDNIGLRGNGTTAQGLRFWTPNNGNYTELKAQAQAGNISYTLPNALPSVSGQALTATDAGVMSWSTVTTDPAGDDGELQLNDGGAFGASPNLTFGTASTGLAVTAASATTVPVIVGGAAAQTANLSEWNPNGVTVGTRARVTSAGAFSNSYGHSGAEIFGATPIFVGNPTNATALGNSVTIGAVGVAVGNFSHATSNGVAIGYDAQGTVGGIAIGRSAYATTGQFMAGGLNSLITDVYFGKGVTHATPNAYTIHGGGGLGTNVAGAALNVAGGQGTGTGAGGSFVIQTAPAGASGASLNALVNRVEVTEYGLVKLESSPGITGDYFTLDNQALTPKIYVGPSTDTGYSSFEFAADVSSVYLRQHGSNNGGTEYGLSTNDLSHLASIGSGFLLSSDGGHVYFGSGGVVVAKFDDSEVAGDTRLLLYDVDNGTLERVTVGIADSGGAGFKVLRIPN
jgi:hypothetical protein